MGHVIMFYVFKVLNALHSQAWDYKKEWNGLPMQLKSDNEIYCS